MASADTSVPLHSASDKTSKAVVQGLNPVMLESTSPQQSSAAACTASSFVVSCHRNCCAAIAPYIWRQ